MKPLTLYDDTLTTTVSDSTKITGMSVEMKDCIIAHYASKPVISDTAAFAVDTLKRYAHETGNLLRGTSDLSPLEEWLLVQLFEIDEGQKRGCKGCKLPSQE